MIKKIIFIMVMVCFIPAVFAVEGTSASYTVGSMHIGAAGGDGTSASYTSRDTVTYQQGSYQLFSSASYTGTPDWHFIPPVVTPAGGGSGDGGRKEPVRETIKDVFVEKAKGISPEISLLFVILFMIILLSRKKHGGSMPLDRKKFNYRALTKK